MSNLFYETERALNFFVEDPANIPVELTLEQIVLENAKPQNSKDKPFARFTLSPLGPNSGNVGGHYTLRQAQFIISVCVPKQTNTYLSSKIIGHYEGLFKDKRVVGVDFQSTSIEKIPDKNFHVRNLVCNCYFEGYD